MSELSETTRRRLLQAHLDNATDDGLAPARGIAWGCVISLAIWAGIAALLVWA